MMIDLERKAEVCPYCNEKFEDSVPETYYSVDGKIHIYDEKTFYKYCRNCAKEWAFDWQERKFKEVEI